MNLYNQRTDSAVQCSTCWQRRARLGQAQSALVSGRGFEADIAISGSGHPWRRITRRAPALWGIALIKADISIRLGIQGRAGEDKPASALCRLQPSPEPCAGLPGSSSRIPLFLDTSPTAICAEIAGFGAPTKTLNAALEPSRSHSHPSPVITGEVWGYVVPFRDPDAFLPGPKHSR